MSKPIRIVAACSIVAALVLSLPAFTAAAGAGEAVAAAVVLRGRMAFIRNGDVYIRDMSDGGTTQITFVGNVTAISPRRDGTEMVYATWTDLGLDNYRYTIEAIKPGGAGHRVIADWTDSVMEPISAISCSPTEDCAYWSYYPHEPPYGNINRVDLATGVSTLVIGTVDQGDHWDSFNFPAVSPDGTKLACTNCHIKKSDLATQHRICVMNLDGTGQNNIVEFTSPGPFASTPPSWSFDGSYIAYSGSGGQVYTVPAGGGAIDQVSDPAAGLSCGNADWTPEGAYITFDGYTDPDTSIYAATVSGHWPEDLTTGTRDEQGRWFASTTRYFAEGYTGDGFDEWLCLLNPTGSPTIAYVTYMYDDGTTRYQSVPVGATTRVTVNVNEAAGAGRNVSMKVASAAGIVAERPMYFDYGPGWTGGHDVVGAGLSDGFFFAEGYTGDGFDEWLCLLNPSSSPITVHVTYMFEDGSTHEQDVPIGGNTRETVSVNREVGAGRNVSMAMDAGGAFFLAERPMYFNYEGKWTGGHDVVGLQAMADFTFLFAEGYTGEGFDEWLCLLSPDVFDADVVVAYIFDDGSTHIQNITVPAHSRRTINVNEEVGAGRNVSIEVTSNHRIVAERPMYFAYHGAWTGGHDVVGLTRVSDSYLFAEGCTGDGFEEWLCLANFNAVAANAHVTYMFDDGTTHEQDVMVGGNTRVTINVNEEVGPGRNVSVLVEAEAPGVIVAERPMYFSYGAGWTGGHDVIGYGQP